jgi:hypothetical protein
MVMVIFGDACSDHADVRGRAAIEQHALRCFNVATDMALQRALQQHRASTSPTVPLREAADRSANDSTFTER